MVNCHSLLTLNITRPHMLILNIISIFKLMLSSHTKFQMDSQKGHTFVNPYIAFILILMIMDYCK